VSDDYDIEMKMVAELMWERLESNHYRFIIESRSEDNSITPLIAVSEGEGDKRVGKFTLSQYCLTF